MNHMKHLSVLALNCRGLSSKLGEFKLMLYTKKPEIVCLCETWLSKKEPKFIDYSAIWNHRDNFAGGLGCLVRKGVQAQKYRVTPYANGKLEYQAVKIIIENRDPVIVFNLYNANKNITVQEFRHYIAQLGSTYIFIGDFNAHSPVLSSKSKKKNGTGRSLEHLLLEDNICIINPIDFYTYLSPLTGKLSCLDLCLTSANLSALTSIELSTDVGSDHRAIMVKVHIKYSSYTCIQPQKFKLNNKCELENFVLELENIANNNCIAVTLEEKNEIVTSKIINAAKNNLSQTTGNAHKKKCTPWWNERCSKVVAERRVARKKLEKSCLPVNLQRYRQKTTEAKHICEEAKKKSFQSYVSEIKYDTPMKEIWEKIRAIKSNFVPQTYPLCENDNFLTDPVDKANCLLKAFKGLATLDKYSVPTDFNQTIREAKNNDSPVEYNSEITIFELEEALANIKNTSPGKDKIPNKLLKIIPDNIKHELLDLFNMSYSEGIVPVAWKQGVIIPILKPEKPEEIASSYRPITLLSCMGKLLEKIIQSRLQFLIEKSELLLPMQSGFRKGKSTIDILLRIEHQVRQTLQNREVCLVVYIDLESAFDKIWGKGLIYKLCKKGIHGNMIKWLESYLEERKMQVRLDGYYSDEQEFESGVPQGGICSPILFNLMMIDIPQAENVYQHIYADDFTVTCSGKDINQVQNSIQEYLNLFDNWCKRWGLRINSKKTYVQMFTRKKIQPPIVRLANRVLEYKKEKKLLGLILDSPTLTWKCHINNLKTNCCRRLDVMKAIASTNWGASGTVLRQFYLLYIQSKLDYGAIVYSSASESTLQKLEIIQNSAMRMILGARRSSPLLSLQAESHIPSLALKRSYLTVREYIKLSYRPKNDFTSKFLGIEITSSDQSMQNSKSFMDRAYNACSKLKLGMIKRIPTEAISDVPSWVTLNPYIIQDCEEAMDKETFLEYLGKKFDGYTLIYSDGSKREIPVATTACGIYIPHQNLSIC